MLSSAGWATASEKPTTLELIANLANADFRVRVQAALSLGKRRTGAKALIRALGDRHASVRGAAAAALQRSGDRHSLPALYRARKDSSKLVRRRVAAAISAIERRYAASEEAPSEKILVKLGSMKNGSKVRSRRVALELASASRAGLAELPDVQVLDEARAESLSDDERAVMLTGRVQALRAARRGKTIVYTAAVEYVVQKLPERVIVAKLTGSASTQGSLVEARDRRHRAHLRSQALKAAIASAIRRAGRALVVAAAR